MPTPNGHFMRVPQTRKHLGQHYLISHPILKQIVYAAKITPNQQVVEIGPGTGKLTQYLAQAAKRVIALEIDPRLCQFLEQALKDSDNIDIIQADAAKYDYQQLAERYLESADARFKLVANLPYYLSTPILLKLIKHKLLFEQIIVMLQAEFVQRLAATPGTKAYGSLTVILQYHMHIESLMPVPSECFSPRPKVDSAVVRLTPLLKPRVAVRDEGLFFKLVRAAFAQRRKTIYNALSHAPTLNLPSALLKEALTGSKIDPGVRGETLSLEGFAELADNVWLMHRN